MGPACPVGGGSAAAVPADMQADLRQHGMDCPIRGLDDPRLQYPDLLITSGWTRDTVNDGWAYTFTASQNTATGDSWQQTYQSQPTGDVLVTRDGHRVQTLSRSADGKVTSQIKLVP